MAKTAMTPDKEKAPDKIMTGHLIIKSTAQSKRV